MTTLRTYITGHSNSEFIGNVIRTQKWFGGTVTSAVSDRKGYGKFDMSYDSYDEECFFKLYKVLNDKSLQMKFKFCVYEVLANGHERPLANNPYNRPTFGEYSTVRYV